MTHKELVKRASLWLRNRKRCMVVLTELTTAANNEIPDVLGFYYTGGSILIECKASRADFLADRNKIFRRCSEHGMGDQRFLFAESGLLSKDDLPSGWGLLECEPHRVKQAVESGSFEANKKAEVIMLASVLRRLEISTAVFVRQ
ncbi:MAG: hypothetical protein ACE14T_12130 [Syntrophales bacterium]